MILVRWSSWSPLNRRGRFLVPPALSMPCSSAREGRACTWAIDTLVDAVQSQRNAAERQLSQEDCKSRGCGGSLTPRVGATVIKIKQANLYPDQFGCIADSCNQILVGKLSLGSTKYVAALHLHFIKNCRTLILSKCAFVISFSAFQKCIKYSWTCARSYLSFSKRWSTFRKIWPEFARFPVLNHLDKISKFRQTRIKPSSIPHQKVGVAVVSNWSVIGLPLDNNYELSLSVTFAVSKAMFFLAFILSYF